MSSMRIRFGSTHGIVTPLELEGSEGQAPLDHLCSLLFQLRVQILAVEEDRRADRVIHRLRVCEFDGGALSPRRRRTIAAEVAAALGLEREPQRAA